jgi:hypothetical protein
MDTTKQPGPRADQEARLARLEEKLLDVFLDEGDPDGWINAEKAAQQASELAANGDSKGAKELLTGWKGHRYWEKKNANQTMALITRIVTYRKVLAECPPGEDLPLDTEEKLRQDMSEAEGRVRARLKAIKGGKR